MNYAPYFPIPEDKKESRALRLAMRPHAYDTPIALQHNLAHPKKVIQ